MIVPHRKIGGQMGEFDPASALFNAVMNNDVDQLITLFGDTPEPNFVFFRIPRQVTCFGAKPIPCLNVALSYGSTYCIQYLIEAGANIDLIDGDGYGAFHAAAFSGNPEILDYLESKGADPNALSTNGSLPIHIATANDCCSAVNWFFDHNIDLDAMDGGHRTPLSIAVRAGFLDLVHGFVAHNADVTTRDLMRNSLLHIAIEKCHYEVARFLMSLDLIGYNSVNFSGITFLMIACRQGNLELVMHLLNCSCDPSLLDRRGRSLLHYAVESRNPDLVQFLLERQTVNPTLKDIVPSRFSEEFFLFSFYPSPSRCMLGSSSKCSVARTVHCGCNK
jgi:ankyrin repeat protein